MNYLGMIIIGYLIFGTITTLIHIRSVERAMCVKQCDDPLTQTWVLIVFIVSWPYIAWPPRGHFRRHR